MARELVRADREALRDVVQNLAATVTARLRPAGGRVRRFDRVADVLAIPVADLSETAAPRCADLTGVGRIGPNLLAPDEHLVGAVDRRERLRTRHAERGRRDRAWAFVPRSDFRLPRFGFQVPPHPLFPTLPAAPGLPVPGHTRHR